MELQQHTTASGTGSESGATYTINDIFHEGFESPNPPALHLRSQRTRRRASPATSRASSFLGHFVFQGVMPSGQDFKVTASLAQTDVQLSTDAAGMSSFHPTGSRGTLCDHPGARNRWTRRVLT